jgi:hypothetical protein
MKHFLKAKSAIESIGQLGNPAYVCPAAPVAEQSGLQGASVGHSMDKPSENNNPHLQHLDWNTRDEVMIPKHFSQMRRLKREKNLMIKMAEHRFY